MKRKQKTSIIWSVICKKAIVDDQTKLISIIDILEKLILDIDIEKAPDEIKQTYKDGAWEKPIQVQGDITVASYWELSKENRKQELTVETRIFDFNNRELAMGQLTFNVDAITSYQRTFVKLPTFPVVGSGRYQVESSLVSKDGNLLSQSTLPIIVEVREIKPKQ